MIDSVCSRLQQHIDLFYDKYMTVPSSEVQQLIHIAKAALALRDAMDEREMPFEELPPLLDALFLSLGESKDSIRS